MYFSEVSQSSLINFFHKKTNQTELDSELITYLLQLLLTWGLFKITDVNFNVKFNIVLR